MPKVVGVAFRKVCRSYYFDPSGFKLEVDDRVVVETSQGMAVGTVTMKPHDVLPEDLEGPLKPIIRVAAQADLEREKVNKEKAERALPTCEAKIIEHKLPMKLVNAEYNYDASVITFFFVSESRVDFRELVKDVAKVLHCRIMFYQIGARDQAKSIGGAGICGLALCCHSFLTDFSSISMRMAKEQDLFLNPVKFSGVCGKLLCCLSYEHEVYKEARTLLPTVGDACKTPRGSGVVTAVNIIQGVITVQLAEGDTLTTFTAGECDWESKKVAFAMVGQNGKHRHCGVSRRKYREDEDEDNSDEE